MRIEEEFESTLRELETAIVAVYRKDSNLLDTEVMRALEASINLYSAEQHRRAPREMSLNEQERLVCEAVKKTCETLLGRPAPEGKENSQRLTLDELVRCLKRIRKSVEFWYQSSGRQGYLKYVRSFV